MNPMTGFAAKGFLAGFALLVFGLGAQAQTQRIANIFDPAVPAARLEAADRFNGCARPPAPIVDHQSVNIYADPANRTISGERWVRQSTGTRGIREFAALTARFADRSLLATERRDARAACAARWLEAWARGRAFLGDVPLEARYDTIWFGQISLGVSYLKIMDNPGVTPAQREAISAWLVGVARAAIRDEAALVARNGEESAYRAWTVAAAAVAAVSANDRELLEFAMAGARRILDSVTPAGALPSELTRGRRTFQHHVWAFEPLALTALIAQRNGVRLADANDRALRRLAQFIIASSRGDAPVAELARSDQDSGIHQWPRPFETGALEIFNAIEQVREVEDILRSHRPAHSPFTGGDWTNVLLKRMPQTSRPPT